MSFRARLFFFGFLLFSMDAKAGLFGIGGTSWEEEALLHDGNKIIVTRTVERGGRHEIGQQPPYKDQSLTFTMPVTGQRVTWNDRYSERLGSSTFLPMLVDISGGTAYLVAYPMGCLAYNIWGRPNPPYVVFRYLEKEWKRIALQELPIEIMKPNLIFSSPDTAVEKLGKRLVTSEMIQQIEKDYRQPEYKTILREPLSASQLCPPEQTGFKAPYPIRANGGVSESR